MIDLNRLNELYEAASVRTRKNRLAERNRWRTEISDAWPAVSAMLSDNATYHAERQQLRDILRIDATNLDGTSTAEFDAQPSLVDAARIITAELATLREFARRVREADESTRFGAVTRKITIAIDWLDAETKKEGD